MKLAILIFMMLVVVSCTQVSEETTQEMEMVFGEEIVIKERMQEIKLIELRIIDGSFYPETINVDMGDKVRIQFMDTDTYVFSIYSYNIAETVNGNTFVEFTADKKGTFSFECLDCKSKATGTLRVI